MFDSDWAKKPQTCTRRWNAAKLKLIGIGNIENYSITGEEFDTVERYMLPKISARDWVGMCSTTEYPDQPLVAVDRKMIVNTEHADLTIQNAANRDTDLPILIVGIDWWNGEPWRVERAKLVLCS